MRGSRRSVRPRRRRDEGVAGHADAGSCRSRSAPVRLTEVVALVVDVAAAGRPAVRVQQHQGVLLVGLQAIAGWPSSHSTGGITSVEIAQERLGGDGRAGAAGRSARCRRARRAGSAAWLRRARPGARRNESGQAVRLVAGGPKGCPEHHVQPGDRKRPRRVNAQPAGRHDVEPRVCGLPAGGQAAAAAAGALRTAQHSLADSRGASW